MNITVKDDLYLWFGIIYSPREQYLNPNWTFSIRLFTFRRKLNEWRHPWLVFSNDRVLVFSILIVFSLTVIYFFYCFNFLFANIDCRRSINRKRVKSYLSTTMSHISKQTYVIFHSTTALLGLPVLYTRTTYRIEI